jgi:hypothetical protein
VSTTPPMSHDSAFELLPWLANGTLAAAEREVVNTHVRTCIVCRRELRSLERLAVAIRREPAVDLSVHTQFEQLERELDGPAARWSPLHGPHGSLFRFATVAVMGVALLGLLLWLTPTRYDGGGDFATLASPPATDGGQVDIVFDPAATDTEIRQVLAEIHGTIVAGPTNLGRYTVRVTTGDLSETELKGLVEKLTKDRRIRFAGRSYSERTP